MQSQYMATCGEVSNNDNPLTLGIPGTSRTPATILCDNTPALQAIRHPGNNKSDSKFFMLFSRQLRNLRYKGSPYASSGYPGIEMTPGMMQQTGWPRKLLVPLRLTFSDAHFHARIVSFQTISLNNGNSNGRFPMKGDICARWTLGSLPSIPDGCMGRRRHHTHHSWLVTHGKLNRHREDDKCVCDAKETVVHVRVDCPRLKELRQERHLIMYHACWKDADQKVRKVG